MDRRLQIFSVIAALVILVVGLLIVFIPREPPLAYTHFTNLEEYPHYYYVNFTVQQATDDTALVLDLRIDRTNTPVSFYLREQLYQVTLTGFQTAFNITEAADDSPAIVRSLNPIMNNGGTYTGVVHTERSISEGQYVYVFWIVPSGIDSGWSATIEIHLDRFSITPAIGT